MSIFQAVFLLSQKLLNETNELFYEAFYLLLQWHGLKCLREMRSF